MSDDGSAPEGDADEDSDGSDEFAAVVEEVRERVTPDAEERERLRRVAADLVERTAAAAADLPVEADVVQVGSTARGTWISGDRDVDVFVRFPPDLERDRLEEYGLRVGRVVLPDGHEEYAEHPYVTGEREGFAVDLVPCYRVEHAGETRSAVDRTPFHTRYLEARLDEATADEVRVCKAFLKGIGVYGSDLRTRGFSGYLTELLVLEFGGFRDLLEAAADWSPPVVLDPADHGTTDFEAPLVVVDPTDPGRNVAAVLSPDNLARLQHYARRLLADPDEALFEPRTPEPVGEAAVRTEVERRGTTPLAVRFDAPDLVADQLYPQLRRSLDGVVAALDRHGFDVLRAATFADEAAVLFVECAVGERPAVERHAGPPVAVRDHAEGFYGTYAADRRTEADLGDAEGTLTYGPYVDGDRYVVERERAHRTPHDLLENELFEVALGKDVDRALREGHEVLVGGAVAGLAEEFGVEFARYFSPRP